MSTTVNVLAGRRVLVAERQDLLRAGMVETIRRLGAVVVGDTGDGRHVPQLIVEVRAQLVVVGGLGDEVVSDVVLACKSVEPDVPVVHLTAETARDEYIRLLRSGVDAVSPLAATVAELGEVLGRVIAGERVFAGTALAAVRSSLDERHGGIALTTREREVLAMLASNRTMAQIAGELYLSRSTVKSHVCRVYAKLEARGRHEAVERAVSLKLLG
ncbi:MAG: response regulator transcription factor [Acidimicrobiales bacterium]|nr:response regulator transcription factor [Acidimicrobiales bacterium]